MTQDQAMRSTTREEDNMVAHAQRVVLQLEATAL
jgi:hypothetical protein